MTETIATKNNGHSSAPVADLSKLGAGPGLIAPKTLNVKAYVDDFNTTVIDAYRRGVADVDLPADAGVGRSLIAPFTAATRDFSALSPLIPALMAAIQLTTALFAGQPLAGDLLNWLKLLIGFDIIFTALALGLVETVLVG